MNIQALINPVTKFAAKAAFKIKAAAPEILIGAGVVGVVGSVVLACKETPKAIDIIAEHEEMIERIKEVHENPEEYSMDYSEVDYRKDIVIQYANTSWKLVKTYAPAMSLLAVSLGAILYSHGIMSKRNLELLAAYKALEESFDTYRKRVQERFGNKADFNAAFIDNFTGKEKEMVDENGNKRPGEEVEMSTKASPYARFFDETNINWEKDPTMNMFFLQAQEKFANERLQRYGYLFLNDVYEALGFPRVPAGQLVGWFVGGDGDDCVSFGIFDGHNDKKRDFVNGFEPAILLDFNVDGVIYDMI